MNWQRLGRNILRYLLVGAVVSVPGLYYGPTGYGLTIGSAMPAMAATTLAVEFISSTWPQALARATAVVGSTIIGYLGTALVQTAAGMSDVPPSISPWSPTYLPTFLGLCVGFVFGWFAILRPRPIVSESQPGSPRL